MTKTDTQPTPQEILLTPLPEDNDANAATIGQFLAKLTKSVWREEESFSGKRPFGNSGWKIDIAQALILEGHLDGSLDEDGYVEDYANAQFDSLMSSVLDLLLEADYSTLAPKPEPTDWYVIQLDLEGLSEPVLKDYYLAPMTEEGAKTKVEELKEDFPFTNWFAVQIPS